MKNRSKKLSIYYLWAFPAGRAIRYIFFAFQDKKDAAAIPYATVEYLLIESVLGLFILSHRY